MVISAAMPLAWRHRDVMKGLSDTSSAKIFKHGFWLPPTNQKTTLENPCYLTWILTWIFLVTQAFGQERITSDDPSYILHLGMT